MDQLGIEEDRKRADLKIELWGENDRILPVLGDLAQWKEGEDLPDYEAMKPFMHFLNKYVTLLVGVRELNAYFRANPGDTLLDRVTVSDVAYTILLYESTRAVWEEDAEILDRNPTENGKRMETLKKVTRSAKLKYHVQKGARIPFGVDGWTTEGKMHYKLLVTELEKVTKTERLYEYLEECWSRYAEEHTMGDRPRGRDEMQLINERLAEEEVEEIDLPGDDDDGNGMTKQYGLTTHI